MNQARRIRILRAIDDLRTAKFDEIDLISSQLDDVLAEEQDAFENMPESLQEGDRGMESQDAQDLLDSAIGELNDIDEEMDEDEFQEAVENAVRFLEDIE